MDSKRSTYYFNEILNTSTNYILGLTNIKEPYPFYNNKTKDKVIS